MSQPSRYTERTIILLSKEQRQVLEAQAKARNVSMSDQIRHMLFGAMDATETPSTTDLQRLIERVTRLEEIVTQHLAGTRHGQGEHVTQVEGQAQDPSVEP